MKTIGLLGGTSWPSTCQYYNYLNARCSELLGGFHSAKLILYSIDYHDIKQHYNQNNAWEIIPGIFLKELQQLLALPIDGYIICNNTLHKALDILRHQGLTTDQKPCFHALALTANEAQQQGYKKVLLLGTKFTMTDDFFKTYFIHKKIDVITPTPEEMDLVQAMQNEVAANKTDLSCTSKTFESLLDSYQQKCDAIVLGCTELPMLIRHPERFRLLNPIDIQCEHAVKFMLG